MKTTHLLSASALALALSLGGVTASQAAETPTETTQIKLSAEDFVKKASTSNLFEIQSSEMALQKSENPQVEEFARQMIEDHRKAGEELKTTVGESDLKNGLTANQLDAKYQNMLDELTGLEGDEFNRKYIDIQTKAHEEAVTLFRNYAEEGDHAELQAFAESTLPTLEKHRQHVGKLQDNM